jgi:hypothetical protein
MKIMTKSFVATALSAMALVGPGAARAAHAQVSWSSIAAGCVLDSASLPLATTSAVNGSVTFKGTTIGRIRLTCPVTALMPSLSGYLGFNQLSVSYYDRDGAGTTCQVKAFLLRTNTDALERGWTITGFDSNTGASTTEAATGRSVGTAGVPESPDVNANYYWVDLELFRSATTCNPIAVGVYLNTITF